MSSSQPVSYFSLPLARWQQPLSFRTAKYEPPKQRNKDLTEDDEGSEETGDEEAGVETDGDAKSTISEREPMSSYSSTLVRSSVLTPNESHQYRIAGYSTDYEVPGGNFPHGGGPPSRTGRVTKQQVETELSELSPPVFLPGAERNALHLRHLAVITAILHRCLMEGDYIRAGRAWGLLLRDDFGGHPIDIRTEGRWGIGAEILLWKDQSQHENGQTNAGPGHATDGNNRWLFSRSGFERAKAYYERLILQYPFRKTAPHALSSLDFYPAMFGLWIATIQDESRTMREMPLENDERFDTSVEDVNDDDSYQQDRRQAQRAIKAYGKELAEAQQLATQMDELLVSFPFSDSYELLRLRGMMSLWIADLHVSSASTNNDDMDVYGDGDGDVWMENSDPTLEERFAQEKRSGELEKAQNYFDKATSRVNRGPAPPR